MSLQYLLGILVSLVCVDALTLTRHTAYSILPTHKYFIWSIRKCKSLQNRVTLQICWSSFTPNYFIHEMNRSSIKFPLVALIIFALF
jgi:hypothetical protein